MKKKLLFFMVATLAFTCLFVTASASTINDVIFTNGAGEEVYILQPGEEIGATLDVTVSANTTASLITAAFEDNRLTNIRYQGDVSLSTAQKTYEALPVSVTANTTRVDVMLWGADDLSPLDTKESLTSTSREISVSDFVVTSASGKQYRGIVDNDSRKINVEQIVDIYCKTNNTTYSKYYDVRTGDFQSLNGATVNYKLNGVDSNAAITTLDLAAPTTLTMTAPSGRTKDYTISVDHNVSGVVANFDSRQTGYTTPQFDTSTANQIGIRNYYSEPQFGADYSGYYGDGSGVRFYFTCIVGSPDIKDIQDTSLNAYYNVSFAERAQGDNCVKFIKKGNTGGWPAAYLKEHSDRGTDKTVYSFDFKCEALDKDTPMSVSVVDKAGKELVTLNFEKKSNEDKMYLTYASTAAPAEENMGGWGKRIAEISIGEWNNVKIIIDRKNSDNLYTICLNDQVMLKTNYQKDADAIMPQYFNYASLRFATYSTSNTTTCLDNIMAYYSEASA